MLTIDGSVLEGGGQVVRTAVALSAITGTPVTIHTIRAGREKPGLKAQHIAAIQAVAKICHARCKGLIPGSDRVIFIPGDPVREDIRIDIGTAGSISLVIQAWLPVALHVGGSVTVSGGTEVQNSPTIDYAEHLHLNFLRQHGADLTMTVMERGYYPEGGGQVRLEVHKPVDIGPFNPVTRENPRIELFSCSSHLPSHVAERQAESARIHLGDTGKMVTIHKDTRQGPGAGSSITVICGWKGSSAIGRRGLPAETVGKTAAVGLLDELKKMGAIDLHLADQLLIYLAQYGGAFTATECTLHSRTVCLLLGMFGFHVKVRQNKGAVFCT
ncbi:MAG: RNA 3'-terminal phosphate cyclase [Methanoregulaceae archaeon]|jgi:RNA 3'-terminal phosphate cyclase (ATP)|nr:RNA 3'-terminal phosphate cyclase [Methanoregulaceae archaeon]